MHVIYLHIAEQYFIEGLFFFFFFKCRYQYLFIGMGQRLPLCPGRERLAYQHIPRPPQPPPAAPTWPPFSKTGVRRMRLRQLIGGSREHEGRKALQRAC